MPGKTRWVVASALILLAGALLVYAQPWRPRVRVLRDGGTGPPDLVLLRGDDVTPARWLPDARSFGLPAEGRLLLLAAPYGNAPEHGLPGGRVWWDLDLRAHRRPGMSGVDLTSIDPGGLQRAAARVRQVLEREGNGPARPFVLGGFSQGALVASEVAFNSDEPLSALVLLSGAYVDSTGWGWNAPRRRGLPVFIAHGRRDGTFPFDQAERLAIALARGRGAGHEGADVTFVPFDGGHEVTAEVQAALLLFLARVREAEWRRQSDPAGAKPTPRPPSNVADLPRFPDGLPACGSNVSRSAPLRPGLDLVAKKVTFTATLSLEKRRSCSLAACSPGACCNTCGIRWQLVVGGDADVTIALRRSLTLKDCEPAPATEVPVLATGVVALDEVTMVPEQGPRFALEHANLCALGPLR
jgi:phospholipase/carboxylesterase